MLKSKLLFFLGICFCMTVNATEVLNCGGGVADSDAETDGIEIGNGVCAELFEDLGAVSGGILINTGATLTVYGDITSLADKIEIKSGGTLILYGNIGSVSNGILISGTLEIYSNVTVDGGFEIKNASTLKMDGGYLTVTSGNGKLNSSSSELQMHNGSTIEIVDGASKIDNNGGGFITSDNSGNSIETQTWDGDQGDFNCASGSCSDSASSAKVIITESGGSTITTESGTTDSFTVELSSALTVGTVRVDFSSGNTSEGTVSPSFVTFSLGNMGAKTVTVTPVDDEVDDGPQFYTITATTSTPIASTPDYDGVPTPDVGVLNKNDGQFPRIDLTASTLISSENGSNVTFDAVIGSQPASGKVVQLDVSSGDLSEGTISPASLTFDEFNWDTPQTVTVTPVDDTPVDGDIDYDVTLTVNSGVANADGDYSAVPDAIVTVTNQDDEAAGFTLNTAATGNTTELGGSTTFTVVLDDEPLSNVVLRTTSLTSTEGQVTPTDPFDITFTPTDWFTPQTITVIGQDDVVLDGNIAYQVRVRVQDASSDDFFDPLADQFVDIINEDDDGGNAAPVITGSTVSTTEDTPTSIVESDLGYSDGDSDPLVKIRISTLPISGTLFLDTSPFEGDYDAGEEVVISQEITLSDINNGYFMFVGDQDDNGISYASFDFQANDGTDYSSDATITIDVTAVNDAPVFTLGSDINADDNTKSYTITGFMSSYNDGDPDATQNLSVTVSADDVTLFDVQPDINISTGNLSFTVSNNKSDVDTITVTLTDDGGTLNGGANSTVKKFAIRIFDEPQSTLETIPTGSYIVDMGSATPTYENSIKPYGLVYQLTRDYSVPIKIAINQSKGKDGIDFSHEGRDYKGAPFIISEEFRTTAVDSIITIWEGKGVEGYTTTTDANNVPIYITFSAYTTWTIDQDNQALAIQYFDNAEIPSSAYTIKLPSALDGSDDIFILPHADPDWANHGNLLNWNRSVEDGGDGGWIWVGCHAASVLEQITNPADPSEGLNFLTTNTLYKYVKDAHEHVHPVDPFSYDYHSHPFMQFMQNMDGAVVNGSEQAYLPEGDSSSLWLSTNKIGVWDPDFDYSSSKAGDPPTTTETAAILVWGHAFGDPRNGKVLYQGGHNLNDDKGTPHPEVDAVAAQRAFFNFSILSPVAKVPVTSTFTVPSMMTEGLDYSLTIDATARDGSTPTYSWSSGCGGSFDDATSATPTFTAPVVGGEVTCIISVTITDLDGRQSFESASVTISGNNVPTVTGSTVSVVEDVSKTIKEPDLGYADTDSDPLSKIKISTLPANGTLFLDTTPFEGDYDTGEEVSIGQEIISSDLSNGYFMFVGDQDENGNSYASFDFQANDGTDYSTNATITIDVTAVNDDPSITTIADQSTNEDTDKTGIAFTVDEGGGTDENAQALTVTATSSNTTLVPNGNITVNYTDNGGSSANALSPTIDITPSPDLSGTTTITVTVQDNGTGTPSVIENFVLTVNQVAEFSATTITGNTDESGSTETFNAVLNSKPNTNVVLTVTSGNTGEGTVDKATLTFTPANWDTPQTVTVTGVDDDIIDGDITYNVTLSVDDANSDNDFDPLADQTVSVTNTDDDVAGFTITETAASTETAESATTDTFDVELDAEPGSNVVLTVTSDDTGEGTVDLASLTFTPANWDTPQTVTVTGVDDDIIDGDITYNVTLSIDDANSDDDFDPLGDQTVSVTNTNDDVAGFTITETAASTDTDESATTDTFDVELDAEPGSNVVLTVTSGDTGEGTVDKATLTFTPANWDTPQTVTVTGVDDDIIDGDITYNVTLSVDDANSDDDFDPLADQTVSVTNTNDDVAGFTITETAASTDTDESATTDTFDVELDAEPGSNVVITVTSGDTGEGTVDLASLTFTPANWDTPQTVTVTGVDDDIIDGDITYNVTLSVDDASSDNDFDPLADQTVSVTNTDDDVAGFTITETAASTDTDESATTDTFDVELDAEPGSNVVITVTSGDTGEGTVDLASLTFTPANWDTPQTVTVTGVDDDIIDGDITYNVTLSVDDASSDNDFDPLADQTVSVTNTDDDVAGFTITETAASTDTDESATTDTFDVELDAEPGSNVVITVTSGDTGEGTVDLASLTFTPANWDTPQTVTVTGVDDDIIDGDITYNVTLSVDDASSDNDFDPLADQTVSVTNTDDDVAGFTITETAASTDTDESATTDTFDVELDAEPGSNVVITVTSGDTGEGTVDLASLTFTPANWDTPQTVTVTGVDDDIIDGDITYNVTLSVDDASSDNDFDPLADQTVSVTNTDDDVAGFTITETAASTDTDESATTDTFDVELDAEPGSNVVITVTSGDTGEGTVDLASLTFTPANWDTPQTVTVTGVDDDIIDGDITYNVTLSVDDANSDNDFDPLADQTVSVTNTDDDVAGFTITETAASTDTDESATTDTFDVELDAEPGSNVVITVTSGDTGEGTVDLASLTFTPANWDTPQTVTVTGVDDDIIDGDITYNVTLSVDDASSDNDFDPLADQTVFVTNTDDDVAGFTITETAASTGTDESATTDTFDVELDAEPGSNVVITVTSGDTGEGTVDLASLTFTPANWDTPQTVTVTGVDDDIIDGDITYNVTLSVDDANSDNDFDPLADQTVSVTNTDDDVAGFTITETAASTGTDESATTDTFDVELDAEPGSNVVITVTSGDTGEGTVDLASLTFTPANWDTPQTVTVTGVDDDIIDGDITYNVTLSVDDASSDNDFDPLADQTVFVTNTDDDVAGFTITETAASTDTDESATTDTFDVELDAEPGSNVVITVTSGDTGEGTVDLASLTFTPANWDTPQTVTVTGVDDDIIDGDITYNVTLSVDDASSDNDFDPLADQTVSVTNTDDDVAGFTITETAASTGTDESATTDTFDVELDAEPGSNVVITVTSGDTGEGTVDLASLTFTPANWDTPQTVTVTGVDDDIIDGDITYNVTLSVDDASSDNDFDPLADQTVSVTNTDDDVAGFTITETAASTDTDESATTDTFDVELDAEPGSNVVITVTSGDTGEGTVDLASLTFTPANWDTPQTVTVTGVDDDIIDGDITYNVTLSVDDASSDNDFDPLADQTVSVTNTDDDVAGYTLSKTTSTITEGNNDTFTIVLDAEPSSNVVIDLSSDDTGAATVSPSSLTFTSGNWNSTQLVTITSVQDDDLQDETPTITASVNASSDGDFTGLANQNVTVTVTDYDIASISISAISGNTNEDGTTATFTIVLDSEPTADVTIGLSSDNTAEGTVSPASVTFTTANWNVAQTVTVTGVDDAIDDGDVVYNIVTAAAASSDANYNGLDPADVTVTNEDNDGVGISVSAISGNTREDGTTATFTIVLDSEPTADVTIGLSSDNTAEGTVSPANVTFTTANWNVPQTVTVAGVDDAIDDGDVVYNIVTAAAASSDANYNGLDPADVTVTNEDNDGVGISVSAISGNTREDGTTATFTIVLDSEPTADVTIGLSSDNTAEGTVSPASVTFTIANWNVAQTVTVTGVDDNDVDGDVTYTIIISAAASSDANYNGLDPTNVFLINEDDDSINGTPVITGQVSINSIDEDTDFTIALTNLTVTDPDNNYPADHTLILLTGNAYDISGSSIIPQADYNGALRVNIKVSDGVNESNVYEYEVDIQPVNDKPILVADALTVQFGNTLEGNLLTNDSDVENDDLVLTDISPLPDGLIFNTDGSFMYSGDTEIGTIEMDYVVCDNGDPSECAQSTLTLTIEGGDFDGDGIPDSYEIQFDDVDDDGEPEYRDLDSDNDGISDSQEAGADPENPVDTDQDGTPDFLDMDSDGDGKLDSEEGVEDCDRDGILNYIDNDDPCKMKIADAFSPNGDGKNDEWIIQGIEDYPRNKVTIFNRWGNKIFEIDGYDNNSRVWRGEINTNIGSDKNASYSTYYFIIDLKDGSKPIAGNILISR